MTLASRWLDPADTEGIVTPFMVFYALHDALVKPALRGDLAEPMMDSHRPTDALARAVELLEAGDWQQAHEIVQKDESELAAWLHGIVHTLEGDLDNAQYWYRRAGRTFDGRHAVQTEIAAARQTVFGKVAGTG